jgi:cytochrome P450
MAVELPPGPRSRVRTTFELARDYVGAMQSWHQRYGDAFTLRDVAGNTMVVIADPELIRDLLRVGDPEQFGVNAPESLDVLVGRNSLLMRGGVGHQRERKRLQAPVCRRAIGAWAPVIADATREAFESVPIDAPLVALERARAATLQVIVRLVFGAAGEHARELGEAIHEMIDLLRPSFLLTRVAQRRVLGLSAFARFEPASQRFDALLRAHIHRLRDAAPGRSTTVLGSLLAERDEQGQPLPDEVIEDDLRTMLIGGHETTSNALAWALYYVHRDPQLRAQLRAELLNADVSTIDAGLSSPLLRATIDETLRIRPVAGAVYRRLARPLTLGRWELPAGVIVSPAITLLHHRADLWPEPERFDPSRFMAERPSPHVYMPFGGGSHRCLGGPFARFELNVALSVLLSEFELELDEPSEVPWVQLGLPLGPGTGVRMIRRASEGEFQTAVAA